MLKRTVYKIRGIALLETLVALLVMTTGMLGIASLNSHSIAVRAQDRLQLRALRLSRDLVANLQLLRPAERSTAAAALSCDSNTVCSTAEFAGATTARWQARIGRELPQGTSRFALSDNNTRVVIELQWSHARTPQQLRLEAGL